MTSKACSECNGKGYVIGMSCCGKPNGIECCGDPIPDPDECEVCNGAGSIIEKEKKED